MRPDLAVLITQGISFLGCSLLSPVPWLMEMLISPYLQFKKIIQWNAIAAQVQAIPSEVFYLKLLPGLIVCLGVSIGYMLLWQRLAGAFSRFLKQQLISL